MLHFKCHGFIVCRSKDCTVVKDHLHSSECPGCSCKLQPEYQSRVWNDGSGLFKILYFKWKVSKAAYGQAGGNAFRNRAPTVNRGMPHLGKKKFALSHVHIYADLTQSDSSDQLSKMGWILCSQLHQSENGEATGNSLLAWKGLCSSCLLSGLGSVQSIKWSILWLPPLTRKLMALEWWPPRANGNGKERSACNHPPALAKEWDALPNLKKMVPGAGLEQGDHMS